MTWVGGWWTPSSLPTFQVVAALLVLRSGPKFMVVLRIGGRMLDNGLWKSLYR